MPNVLELICDTALCLSVSIKDPIFMSGVCRLYHKHVFAVPIKHLINNLLHNIMQCEADMSVY